MDVVLTGVAAAVAPLNLAFIVLGVSLGIVVGAIPGMSAPTAIAIAVPLTYAMSPVSAIAFLLGVRLATGWRVLVRFFADLAIVSGSISWAQRGTNGGVVESMPTSASNSR